MKNHIKYMLIIVVSFNALFVSSQEADTIFISGKIKKLNNDILIINEVKSIIGSFGLNTIEIDVSDSFLGNIHEENKERYINNNILIYAHAYKNKFYVCAPRDTAKFQKPFLTPTKEPLVILDSLFLKDNIYYDLRKLDYELKAISSALQDNFDDRFSSLAYIAYGSYRNPYECYYYDFIREYAIWEYYETVIKHYCYYELLHGSFYILRNSDIPMKFSYIIDKLLSPPFNFKPKETVSLYLNFIDSDEEYLKIYGEQKLKEAIKFLKKDIKNNQLIYEKFKNEFK